MIFQYQNLDPLAIFLGFYIFEQYKEGDDVEQPYRELLHVEVLSQKVI
jgi:hypothetical protein